VACEPDGGHPDPLPSTGGRSGEGGEGGANPNGSGGQTSSEPGAPSVEVHQPLADAVLGDTLSASCGAVSDDAPGASPVDPTSVLVRLTDEDDEIVLEVPAAPGGDDQFIAEASLAEIPSGLYVVTCSASDSSVPPLSGNASVDVIVDHGPSIEPVVPLADGYLSRAGDHTFEVKIRPVPLFSGDDEAEVVGDPVITIDHQEFTLEPKGSDDPDVYVVEGIDFEDVDLFPETPPDLTAVRVTAENGRGTTGELDYQVAVDGTGPEITIVSPDAATIIGSRVTFVFEITDDFSGVDWDTLVVEAKDVPIPFDIDSSRWTLNGNTATLELNTTEYSVATQMSINVTVADIAGNISDNGAGSTYHLDQVPPSLSLDPPNVRIINDDAFCSHSFDPAGPLAVNHGDDTPNLVMFRAIAWDSTNEEPGQFIFHYSTVDTASLRLWVAKADQALVVDTPLPGEAFGDGTCDAISSAVDADVDAVEMFPVAPGGSAFFGDETGDIDTPALTPYCTYSDTPATEPPAVLCSGLSDMTYALGQKLGAAPAIPAVYAPLVNAATVCTGDQQSVGALLGDYDGWVCAAVTGQDHAGNTSVSPPIAFCMDSPAVPGQPACFGQGADAAPDCTDGCTPLGLPEVWDVGIMEPN